jgi:D-glycerate 3-kinase
MTTSTTAIDASLNYLHESLSDLQSRPSPHTPLIISVSGPQGSGKSYLSDLLSGAIKSKYALKTTVISLDDWYLSHEDQLELAKKGNPLLKGRGLPGTHDFQTVKEFIEFIESGKEGGDFHDKRLYVPRYDKSLYGGEGDRSKTEVEWIYSESIDVIILEGWFLGFIPIDDQLIDVEYTESEPTSVLRKYKIDDILEVNDYLKRYTPLWNLVDVSIFYSTDDITNVVRWRTEQEHELIKLKGEGMADEEIKKFLQRYMVVYELYYKNFVSRGIEGKRNLRINVESDRSVSSVEEI